MRWQWLESIDKSWYVSHQSLDFSLVVTLLGSDGCPISMILLGFVTINDICKGNLYEKELQNQNSFFELHMTGSNPMIWSWQCFSVIWSQIDGMLTFTGFYITVQFNIWRRQHVRRIWDLLAPLQMKFKKRQDCKKSTFRELVSTEVIRLLISLYYSETSLNSKGHQFMPVEQEYFSSQQLCCCWMILRRTEQSSI